MTELLAESEWELGGVRFGGPRSRPLAASKVALGEWTIGTSDVDDPTSDGTIPGVDRDRSAVWSFDVVTAHTSTSADAYAVIGALLEVWASGRRLPPGATMPLRFCAGGRQLVVYGRPRRYSQPAPDLLAQQGRILATFDFLVTDPHVYAYEVDPGSSGPAGTRSRVLTLLKPTPDGGVVWGPDGADVPFWWDGDGSQDRVETIDAGTVAVPFTVTFHGPLRNPTLRGVSDPDPLTGRTRPWELALTGRGGLTLAYDRSVTIDTRARTATFDDGSSAAGYLSHGSRLTTRLPAGEHDLLFAGEDSTSTGTATIAWQPATTRS